LQFVDTRSRFSLFGFVSQKRVFTAKGGLDRNVRIPVEKRCFSVWNRAIIWVRSATPFLPAELLPETGLGYKIMRTGCKKR
jgi:hypothetical protein